MPRHAFSTLRNYPTHDEYSSLRASPRVLNLSKRVHSPVKVRIASPDVVRSQSLLLRQLDAEVKADPCSKESVISAIRQCRRRTTNLEKDRSAISLTEERDNTIKSQLRNDGDSSGASTPISLTSLSTSDVVFNSEVSKRMMFGESRISSCYGIVSKTPRNAISSSISSSRLASNNKKRLFEEILVEEDEIVVPTKKFIHTLQEKTIPHTNDNEVSISIVGKMSKQSTTERQTLGDLGRIETESDGKQLLKRSQGRRKMPSFSAMESSTFLPPSTPYEFTVKDLAETRYQAEERVKRLRQELKEQEEEEQTKLAETKGVASSSASGAQEIPQSHIISTSTSSKGLSQLTSLLKEQSPSNQQVSSTLKSAGLLSQQTSNAGSSTLPGLNLEGLTKSSISNQSSSSMKASSPLITTPLGQKTVTVPGGVSPISAAPISLTQLTASTFNFGGSTKVTPSTIQTTVAKSLTNPAVSTVNPTSTLSLSGGFSAGSKPSSLFNQSLGATGTAGFNIATAGGQGITLGTGDNATSTKHPVIGGTAVGIASSALSLTQQQSVPTASSTSFSFGGLMKNGSNNQPPLLVSEAQKKSTTLPNFTHSGLLTGGTGSLSGSVSTNIFGTPMPTTGPAKSSLLSQQATLSPFQFTSAGHNPDNSSSKATGLFPSGTGKGFAEPHMSSFKPIFGAASPSVTSSMTSQSSFNPPSASKPSEGGFNFNPTSVSKASAVPTAAPAFTFGAMSSTASGVSPAVASTPANGASFNFGVTSAMKNTNTPSINMTGASKAGFNFGVSSQPSSSSSSYQFGQSNPPTYLQSTQSGMTFGQSQTTPAFGQTTQTGFGQSSSSAPAFGQTNQTPFTPVASSTFGQSNQTNMFGQPNQPAAAFGQSSSQPAFGQSTNTGFQFSSASTPSFGQSVGGFGQASQAGPTAFGQQSTPSFGQGENVQQGFNFGGAGIAPTPNFGSSGFATPPAAQNSTSFSVGTGGTIARDRKKYAARRKVNKKR